MDKKIETFRVEVHLERKDAIAECTIFVNLADKITGELEHQLCSPEFEDEWEAFRLAVDLAYKLGAFLFVDGYCYGKLNK